MTEKIKLSQCYEISDKVIAREVEGQMIIVRLVDGIGSIEDELYSLNETGKAIWRYLDGKTSLKDIIERLSTVYDGQPEQIESDVRNLITDLFEKGILVETTV